MAGLSRLRRDRHLLPHWSTHTQIEMLDAMHRYIGRMRRTTLGDRIKRMQAAIFFTRVYWQGYHQSKRSK